MLNRRLKWKILAVIGTLLLSSSILASQSGSKAPAKSEPATSPCKYETLWLDPAADGSPQGREFIKKVAEDIRATGKVRLVKSRKEAQAMFGQVVTSEEDDPSSNTSVTCSNSKAGTDCYSDNFHTHADASGVYQHYTGPVSKTYGWTFLDTKTLLGLNTYPGFVVDFKHPEGTAQGILKGLGCHDNSNRKSTSGLH